MNNKIEKSYSGIRYLDDGQDMLIRWFVLFGVFFVAPLILAFGYIVDMVFNGGIFFFLAFLFVFVYCIKSNIVLLYKIACESDIIKKFHFGLRPDTDFKDYKNSIISSHIRNLNLIWKRSGKKYVNQSSLIEILHAKLKNEGYIVAIASNIMITLGLLGTISGLISSIGGLHESSVDGNVMAGVANAIDGMGVAFYTTLVGSALGGITLKILHFYVDKQIDSYIFTLAEIIEIQIMPCYRLFEKDNNLRDVANATLLALREMNLLKEKYDETNHISVSA